MTFLSGRKPALPAFVFVVILCGLAFTQDLKVLDHSAYDIWNLIKEEKISANGEWVGYVQGPENGDSRVLVKNRFLDQTFAGGRGRDVAFSYDNQYCLFTIPPTKALLREKKLAKVKKKDLPGDSLGIIQLKTGEKTVIPGIADFVLPPKGLGVVAYTLREQPEDTTLSDSVRAVIKEKTRKGVKTLVIRNLGSGGEQTLKDVREFAFSEDGRWLAYVLATPDSSGDGLFLNFVGTGETITGLKASGKITGLAFDEQGERLAFLSNNAYLKEDSTRFDLYAWKLSESAPKSLAEEARKGLPQGWVPSEFRSPFFSDNGERLFFGAAPLAEPLPKDTLLKEEKIDVEVWHWQDDLVYPMQKKQLKSDKKRNYVAVALLEKGRKIVPLASPQVPDVVMDEARQGEVFLGLSNEPYQQEISWDYPSYYDAYLISLKGEPAQKLLSRVQDKPRLSPGGRFLYWWDGEKTTWMARALKKNGETVDLGQGIETPLEDEDHDWPFVVQPYGTAGWLAGDQALVIYDRYDLWQVDPTGRKAPLNLTGGSGRAMGVELRYLHLDEEDPFMPSRGDWLLRAFHLENMDAGFFTLNSQSGQLSRKTLSAHRYSRPVKAQNANVLLMTRESYREFPDLWTAGIALGDTRKISDANPQIAEYAWGSASQYRWYSADGQPLKGILYRPENFDPAQKYPMMVYFYEKNSHNLNRHQIQVPHRSVINPTFYASRGYLVFVPDIPYKIGYPGESAMNAVIPGITQLINEGAVDPARIGVQGHSWGGYQIAYMVTRTHIFRAAEAGAPVSNMFSAYGGMRWGTGMSRMFQYEKTQSRIGGTLWQKPLQFLENSPIFWADKIETPLLILHNDQDGAVPWYQGIELFTAMRRLGKPSWLINYSGEDHWPQTFYKKRDWQIRLQQYFDHYLMDAPAPVWLKEGLPAIEAERGEGLETAPGE